MIRPQHLQTWFSGQAINERPQPFAIITAHNPHSELRTWSQNCQADEQLWKQLKQAGHDPEWIFAGSDDWSHFEAGWTVHGISLENALSIGQAFGQDAIFMVRDGSITIHDCESPAHERFAAWDDRCRRFNNPVRSHCVYVIELGNTVWGRKRFAEANINADRAKPCFYVGRTGLTPAERHARHLAGVKACPLVRDFSTGIAWDQFNHLTRMSFDEAAAMEIALAMELRQEGHGIWQK